MIWMYLRYHILWYGQNGYFDGLLYYILMYDMYFAWLRPDQSGFGGKKEQWRHAIPYEQIWPCHATSNCGYEAQLGVDKDWWSHEPVMFDLRWMTAGFWENRSSELKKSVCWIWQLTLCQRIHYCLVVTGTWLLFSHILGMSSSQLTFIFFRGVGIPPTRLCLCHLPPSFFGPVAVLIQH